MTEILARVRIDSIYDLALGKILKDTGNFSILSSHNLNQNTDANIQPHDVHIGDLDKRIGIQIKGISSAVKMIENTLQEELPDCVLFKQEIQQDSIYLARVSKHIYRKKLAILDIGNERQAILFNFEGQQGQLILVQVKELTAEKGKLPVCSELLTLSGNYVILEIGSSFVRVSRKIKGAERKRLHDIGKELLPDGFGIIIRTSATNIDKESLNFEIEQLANLWKDIDEELDDEREPKRLVSGEVQSEIIFGYDSKKYFDEIRADIETTIPNYHHFKAYSYSTGFTLDFAKKFLDKITVDEMSNTLNAMIMERDYPINNHIKAEFHFADGINEEYNLGDIIENKEYFITRKSMSQSDVDAVSNLDLAVQDIMEVIFVPGSWTIHYKYYSGISNELIGQRVKIITPLDMIYRGRVRAFDMGMDLYYANGELINLLTDHNELNMVDQNMISDAMNEKLGEVYRFASDRLQENDEYIIFK